MPRTYVINLKRRPDRLEKFRERWFSQQSQIPLTIVEAIDGTVENYEIDEDLSQLVSLKNDYKDKQTIRATVFSHLKVWKMIAEGKENYGIIFEDDILFGPHHFDINLSNTLKNYPKNGILYIGVGDCLPIHTNCPSESMLRAQEEAHVIKNFGNWGLPNYKSAYVFDWLGGFSYILTKRLAQYLLHIAKQEPIECAIDSWMKKISLNEEYELPVYLSVPLLTFTTLDDSDTQQV